MAGADQFALPLGSPGDVPAPRNYDRDGSVDLAVFRPSTGQWLVRDQPIVSFGEFRDIPVPRTPWIPLAIAGDYDGEGAADIAVHVRQPTTGSY